MRRTHKIISYFLWVFLCPLVSCEQKKEPSSSYSQFYVPAEVIDTMISAKGFIRINQGAYLNADLDIKGNVRKIVFYEKNIEADSIIAYEKKDQTYMITFHNRLIASFSDYKGLLYEFLYDDNDRMIQRVHHYRDITNNNKVELIYTDFSYDKFGNLLSEFKWQLPEAGGRPTWESYKKYDYSIDNGIVVVKCRGIDDFYRRMGEDSRFVIEYRFANGRMLSETGKKKGYQKNYTYNKDSFLVQYEGNFGDGKQYFIYDRDEQNRLIRYVDSFAYAGTGKHLKAEQRTHYGENTTEVNYYKYPDDKERSGNGKMNLERKTTFRNERIIEDNYVYYFTRHNYTIDSIGNWVAMYAENIWMEDNGEYKSRNKTSTYRELEYATGKPAIRQPLHDPVTERLKENLLREHKDFLDNAKNEY